MDSMQKYWFKMFLTEEVNSDIFSLCPYIFLITAADLQASNIELMKRLQSIEVQEKKSNGPSRALTSILVTTVSSKITEGFKPAPLTEGLVWLDPQVFSTAVDICYNKCLGLELYNLPENSGYMGAILFHCYFINLYLLLKSIGFIQEGKT